MKGSRGKPSGRTLRPKEPLLPPGYHLDYFDPDVLTICSPREETVVARFSPRGYVAEMVEREAWEHYRRNLDRST